MAPTVEPAPWMRLVIFTTTCGARRAVRSMLCKTRAFRSPDDSDGREATASDTRPTPPKTSSCGARNMRSEEHTSELQSLMRISYAVFCLKQKNTTQTHELIK